MIFDQTDYRQCFNQLLESRGRGSTSALAEYLSCRPGFISQVLKGDSTHFSLEHILKACAFFKLNSAETQFLLLLGQYQKAGSIELQDFFFRQIRDVQEAQKKIRSKITATPPQMSDADMGVYYGHWAYMAGHILVSLKENQTVGSLTAALGVSDAFAGEVIEFLVEKGLVERSGNRLSIGKTRLHLPATSPLVKTLHQNWRIKAVESLADSAPDDLHYSSIMTMSKRDAQKVRSLLLELVKDTEAVLKDSPDETAVAMNLDFFSI